MVLIHEELVKRRFSASVCSYAFCFSLLVLVGMVVVPFYIAYGSHNFWLETSTYRSQPTIWVNNSNRPFSTGRWCCPLGTTSRAPGLASELSVCIKRS